MKTTLKLRSFLLACGSLLLANSVSAQLTWDANAAGALQTDGGGTWTNANQWWDGAANVNWTDGNNAIFGNGGAGGAVNVGTVSAGTVLLDNFSGTYTLQNGTLTQSGGFSVGPNAGRVTLGSGMTLTGTGGLSVNGTTLQTNQATLSYTGTTSVTGNGILLSFNNLPAGNVTLNNGKLSDYYRSTTIFANGLGTGASQIQMYGASGFGGGNGGSNFRIGANNSVLTWGALGEGTATGFFNPSVLAMRSTADNNGPSIYGQVTLQNKLDLNGGARTIDVFRSGANIYSSSATIAAGIQDTGGTGGLTKTGEGTLFLGAASTWGGSTNVSAGYLDFGATNLANIGGGTGRNITIGDGAAVRFGTMNNASLSRVVQNSNNMTFIIATSSTDYDFSSGGAGAYLPNAYLSNYAGNGAKAEYSGTVTPADNTYRFGSVLQSGLLGIRSTLADDGSNSRSLHVNGRVDLVAANTFSGETVLDDNSKLVIGNNLALQNSALNVGTTSTGRFSLAAGTATGKITGETAAPSPTLGGLTGSRNLFSVFNAGSNGNNESNLAAAAVTGFTLNVGTGKTHTYSGAIGGFGTGGIISGGSAGTLGDSTLTKTGDGIQILSGTSTYTGATNVDGGTLVINGSISTSSLTTVASGATIGGSGTVGALTVQTGGFISPGNSPGTLNTGNYTQLGLYTADITGLTPGTQHDQINVTGSVDITGGSLSAAFTGGSYALNDMIFLLLNDGGDAITGTYSGFSQGAVVTAFGGFDWQISYVADSVGSSFTGGNDIALMAVAIPEPSAALLGALGAMLLLRRRR
ncbi:autotransporter-associated beta strand repeat-containing protein [Akkermansiaceae bacterium]|nr:autotransporter-associated beta strand repeat-containing protein [Akkermansiaceae bacterium]